MREEEFCQGKNKLHLQKVISRAETTIMFAFENVSLSLITTKNLINVSSFLRNKRIPWVPNSGEERHAEQVLGAE